MNALSTEKVQVRTYYDLSLLKVTPSSYYLLLVAEQEAQEERREATVPHLLSLCHLCFEIAVRHCVLLNLALHPSSVICIKEKVMVFHAFLPGLQTAAEDESETAAQATKRMLRSFIQFLRSVNQEETAKKIEAALGNKDEIFKISQVKQMIQSSVIKPVTKAVSTKKTKAAGKTKKKETFEFKELKEIKETSDEKNTNISQALRSQEKDDINLIGHITDRSVVSKRSKLASSRLKADTSRDNKDFNNLQELCGLDL